MQILVIGGGAAGFFAAITAAEHNPKARVTILERGNSALQKVRVSGGGRCNATHACFDARELVKNYPRGHRELLGPLMQFGPQQTIEWFEKRGVSLKTEADGRMFPTTDDSQTIVECLWQAAKKAGVEVVFGARAERCIPPDSNILYWRIEASSMPEPLRADRLMIATGSSESIWDALSQLGVSIVPPVPSLFTFQISDERLRDLAGISMPHAQLSLEDDKRLQTTGPVLITHKGLSGPAVLKLSAWGARIFAEKQYRFNLIVNWLGESYSTEETLKVLMDEKQTNGRKSIMTQGQMGVPLRLWQSLCTAAGIAAALRWGDASKTELRALALQLTHGRFPVKGRNTFKEEFVTAGGIDLREINFKTFALKRFPGLYAAGEALDIDAVTGGFNFQAAWTGGRLAGLAMAK